MTKVMCRRKQCNNNQNRRNKQSAKQCNDHKTERCYSRCCYSVTAYDERCSRKFHNYRKGWVFSGFERMVKKYVRNKIASATATTASANVDGRSNVWPYTLVRGSIFVYVWLCVSMSLPRVLFSIHTSCTIYSHHCMVDALGSSIFSHYTGIIMCSEGDYEHRQSVFLVFHSPLTLLVPSMWCFIFLIRVWDCPSFLPSAIPISHSFICTTYTQLTVLTKCTLRGLTHRKSVHGKNAKYTVECV